MGAPIRTLTKPGAERRSIFAWAAGGTFDALLLTIVGLPIGIGLIGTFLPAFGYFPAIGATSPSLQPWATLFANPGLWGAVRLSVTTGFAATIIALALATGLCASLRQNVTVRRAEAMLSPLLAAPHAAVAIGLAFVLAPSGWIIRLISPWLTGWTVPPGFAIVGDRYGIALTIGLVVKEVPYLLLVILAALNQIPADRQLKIARALGYGHGVAWIKIVLPQVYTQIRLPVFVVLVYSMSVVDMALVLGPGEPAPLSILALRWFTAPDVARYAPAAAAALLQLGLAAAAIGVWMLAERATRTVGRWWIDRGGRGLSSEPGLKVLTALTVTTLLLGVAALLSLAVWSLAWRWPFPASLPSQWTLDNWGRHLGDLAWPLANTLLVATLSTLIGLIAVVSWLETHERADGKLIGGLIYVPLFLPQIAFLFGTQVSLIRLRLDGTVFAVTWAHLLYVIPYMFIALAGPWRALDPRYGRAAAALGASRLRFLFEVRLPVLLRPVLIACAIGIAVSVAQYLPTLFAGNGRVPTLTTEAVALASGADRRVTGVFAFLQALLPLLVYTAALAIPRFVYANRRALSGRS